MHQEILINVEPQEKRVAILEDRRLEEFYMERQSTQRLVGNIYRGKVEAIVPAIGAAFVNIGLAKNGFLYVQDLTHPDYERIAEIIDKPKQPGEIKNILKIGQEILVQVVKEPLGTKGARLTTHISLPGRYLVLMPCDEHIGISRRIQDNQEKTRLRDILKGLHRFQRIGLIIRTAGQGGRKREFLQDWRYLTKLWRRIKVSTQRKVAPCLIYEEYDLVLRIIRDSFTAQANKLLVDSKVEYKRIMQFLRIFAPSLRPRVQYYPSDLSLFEKKTVEDQILKIYERKASLKSGGYIMIEPTESLVAIDVNSGKFIRKKDPEETAYLVNLEAAREIARQIRLRDIGGIIIIDFIDMKLSKHKKKVFDVLNEALRRDRAKTDISTVSGLGLIEMTRQRVRKSFESVFYQSCPYCQGKGLVKSPVTMAILALRKIRKLLPKVSRQKAVLVFAHPDVAANLLNQNRQSIFNLERKFKIRILIKENLNLHMEELKIETS